MKQLIIELNQKEQELIYGGESRLRFINGEWKIVIDNPD